MTNELKCPFCGGEFDVISIKRKMLGCPKCLHIADGAFWKKAIQAKQDLEIVRQALEEIKENYEERFKAEHDGFTVNWDIVAAFYARTIVANALEQIEHKE